jgi:subtilisin family serine protease
MEPSDETRTGSWPHGPTPAPESPSAGPTARGTAHVPSAPGEGVRHRANGEPRTRQQSQLDLIRRAFGNGIGQGRQDPLREAGVQYLFQEHRMLVRDEYLDRVMALLDGSEIDRSLIHGVTLLRVQESAMTGIERVRQTYGAGVATPDHIVSITGDAGFCPATEPEVVPGWAVPDPGITTDHAAGDGVRVVVIDTGLDPAAAATHPWLAGVSGDADPAVAGDALGPYAGHGTFIAGVVRSVAPQAEVIVRAVFDQAGAIFESNLVEALDKVLAQDSPDVITMSAGTWTFDTTGLLGLTMFHETRLRHHKGVVLVVAAGNDSARQPFWPAAAPWTVSVGALGSNWRTRAAFSNFGGWVDVYAPGENLINAFPTGTYTYQEPPPRPDGVFRGMARWSGTSFSTPLVAGLIAARMSRTGENGRDAAAALLAEARSAVLPGVGAVLLPS